MVTMLRLAAMIGPGCEQSVSRMLCRGVYLYSYFQIPKPGELARGQPNSRRANSSPVAFETRSRKSC